MVSTISKVFQVRSSPVRMTAIRPGKTVDSGPEVRGKPLLECSKNLGGPCRPHGTSASNVSIGQGSRMKPSSRCLVSSKCQMGEGITRPLLNRRCYTSCAGYLTAPARSSMNIASRTLIWSHFHRTDLEFLHSS